MIYLKFDPCNTLLPFVECYFIWESVEEPVHDLVVESPPSGFCSIVFNCGDGYYLQNKKYEKLQVPKQLPLTAGGIWQPLVGKENLRTQWWAPLPGLVGRVTFIDSFVNADETAVTAEFHCEILNPACILRVMDRFKINEEALIIEQENFVDPRAITNPA